jgi:hypothetical protein
MLGRFARLGPARQRLLIATWTLLLTIRLALRPVPQARLRSLLARAARRRARVPHSVEEIRWAVEMAAPKVPRASCLTQALATELLLERSGHPADVRLGVRRDGGAVRAHAWVVTGGQVVVGGEGSERYAPLGVLSN